MNDDVAARNGSRLREFVRGVTRGLPDDRYEAVRDEILGHLVASVEALRSEGVGDAEAEDRSIAKLGSPGRLRRRLLIGLFLRDLGDVRLPALIAFVVSIGFVFVQGPAQRLIKTGWPLWASLLANVGLVAIATSLPLVVTLAALAATGRLHPQRALAMGFPAMGFSFLTFQAAMLVGMILDAATPDSYWGGQLFGPALFGVSHYAFALIALLRAPRWGGRRPRNAEALLLPLPAAAAYLLMGLAWGVTQLHVSEEAYFVFVRWGFLLLSTLDAATLVLVAVRVAPIVSPRVEEARS